MEYEPLQPFFLLALAERVGCGTFLDVGANVGVYSLFTTLVPSIERVVAFEANPDTAIELKANIALNQLDGRIEVQGKAVSDTPGTVTFGVISRFSGANSVVATSIHDASAFHSRVEIESITLDSIFPQAVSRPLCIKIDVEGHEGQVIVGGRKMLETNKAVIQLEGYEGSGSLHVPMLKELGYSQLTSIGPDMYFSNIETLADTKEVVGVYERASAELLAFNHRNKAVVVKRGDFAIQLTGKTGDFARNLARRLMGTRL
jgi:FkbM family methyltransferase